MTQRIYTTYGLTCDQCDAGTPYFETYDAMMRWVSAHGWYHYNGETICRECKVREAD